MHFTVCKTNWNCNTMASSLNESEFRRELCDLLQSAVEGPKGKLDSYLAALGRLDSIAADTRLGLPGELRHFLAKRSYEKARFFVDNLPESS